MNTNNLKGNILQKKRNFVVFSAFAKTVCIRNLNSNNGDIYTYIYK